MKPTWIVVAESARAKIFFTADDGKTLREVADLCHPESRLHNTELTGDLPGRTFDSHGEGRHGMEQATEPKEHEAHTFANEVARYVDRGRSEGEFDALVLAAPPKFLGLLRPKFAKSTSGAIVGELDKNLVECDTKTVSSEISAIIRNSRTRDQT